DDASTERRWTRDRPPAALRPPRRRLPRRHAWGRRDADFPQRRRPPVLPAALRRRGATPRLARSRLLPDDEPLPPRRRSPARRALRRLPPPQRHLCPNVQPPVQAERPSMGRPLLVRPDRQRRAVRGHLRLRPRQPGAGGSLRRAVRLALEWRPDGRHCVADRRPPTGGGLARAYEAGTSAA